MIEKWAATHGGSPPDGMAFPTYDWMAGMRWWPTVFRNAWLGVSIEDRAHGLPRIDELQEGAGGDQVPVGRAARLRILARSTSRTSIG